MKRIIISCIIAFAIFYVTNGSKIEKELSENNSEDLVKSGRLQNDTKTCTQMGFYCDSCENVVMCIESDYGWIEQHVQTCDVSIGETCYRGNCTHNYNPDCDEYFPNNFTCHVPGAFPDPYDCQVYHLCVLTTEGNSTIPTLKGFRHKCPSSGGIQYRYDPKSTYCKYKIYGHCPRSNVPTCQRNGQTGALTENDSIFYVCEEIQNGQLVPQLFACPHGESYDDYYRTCKTEYTTPEYTTTTPYWTTTYRPETSTPNNWTTTPNYWTTTYRPETSTPNNWTTTPNYWTTTYRPEPTITPNNWTTTPNYWTTTYRPEPTITPNYWTTYRSKKSKSEDSATTDRPETSTSDN